MRKILSVAEKPSIAKKIALLLGESLNRGYSHSKYNPVYLFKKDFLGENAEHVVTSVTGHVKEFMFDKAYKDWDSVDPEDLFFQAPLYFLPSSGKENLVM